MIRGKEKGKVCLKLSKKGSRFWKRWRRGLSFWLTTVGYVSAAAVFTGSQSMLGFPWRGGFCILYQIGLHCTSASCLFSLSLVMTFPSFVLLLLFSELWHLACRYESLDNLDMLRQSPIPTATFSYPRPHSAAAGYCAPSRNSYSRYSTGAISSQRNPPVDSYHGR